MSFGKNWILEEQKGSSTYRELQGVTKFTRHECEEVDTGHWHTAQTGEHMGEIHKGELH